MAVIAALLAGQVVCTAFHFAGHRHDASGDDPIEPVDHSQPHAHGHVCLEYMPCDCSEDDCDCCHEHSHHGWKPVAGGGAGDGRVPAAAVGRSVSFARRSVRLCRGENPSPLAASRAALRTTILLI